MSRCDCEAKPTRTRRGSVLLVVLVVIALLALGAYSFSEMMVSESQSAGVFGRETQARAAADSGIELATAVLGRPAGEGVFEDVYHVPQYFAGYLMREGSGSARGRARFSLVAPNESDPTNSTVRFGLIDESSKLNLNALVATEKQQNSSGTTAATSSSTLTTGTTGSSTSNTGTALSSNTSTNGSLSNDTPAGRLLMIPGMAAELADAILDFIDEDDTPRTNGVESEYYQSLTPPYFAKNAPLESLDELLLVAGVTPDLLYGEDANRNGLLDPNENDGAATWPIDNPDGMLQLGWSAYLTVHGREKNVRWDGTPRIYINDNNLADLFDQLEQEFDADVATFVIAFRISGAQTQSNNTNSSGNNNSGGNNSSSGNNNSGSSGGGNSGGGNSGGGNSSTAQLNSQYQQLQQAANALGSAIGGGQGTVTRAGIDLSKGGTTNVTSLFELIGAKATATVNGSLQTLDSPWSASGPEMLSYLPQLFDTLTTNKNELIDGRININQARRETLLTIPGMTESLADSIVAARLSAGGQPAVDATGARATSGWLVIENLTDLETMQQLDQFVTTRGGLYRVQSVGYFDEAGPVTRLEAIIDTTQTNKPPKVIFLQELEVKEFGRGYPAAMLLAPQ